MKIFAQSMTMKTLVQYLWIKLPMTQQLKVWSHLLDRNN